MKDIYELKFVFIEKHKELFEACKNSNVPRQWRGTNGLKIVDLARNEIGYSAQTTAQDIYQSLMKMYLTHKP